ncbi:hypothetical protein CAEBREN_21279 [Caenorhabditis brenneri]|uniref:Uncharacterized protein n=1 Tax=Caenorhabditis brenneri TaxID=135651 RepID=G0NLG0_CAEBE|nr:hypothetical protein CAEBREN_21279 [Caenorhabditis brenneri]
MGRSEGLRVTLSEKLPPVDYYYLAMSLRFGFDHVRRHCNPRQNCQLCAKRSFNNSKGTCFCRPNYPTNIFSTGKNENDHMTIYTDLLYLALEPDRIKRYNADQLLRVIETFETRREFISKPLSNQDVV